MTTTETDAFEAMLTHHAALVEGVRLRVAALRSAVEGGGGYQPAAAELVAYLAREVLPHATAEEHSIYHVAASKEDLVEPVAAMVGEHRTLASSVERLATADDGVRAAAEAEAIEALFTAHVTKENEIVLPALAGDAAVDLTALLFQMHRLTEAAQDETPTAEVVTAPDVETLLVRLVLDASTRLVEAGHGDEACRLAAEAWAAVRVPRPDLAARVTAALHRLVRSVTAEPVAFSPEPSTGLRHGDAELDVRALAPAQRHEKIFATYGALGAGTGFVLVNDHDPKPLRYQFEAEHPGDFTWDVLEAGPTVWRVRIGRPGDDGPTGAVHDGARDATEPAEALELDVRRFPHGQRHDVIFVTFDALSSGAGFILVNDHDPKPLRYQFDAQYPGRYSWDYVETGPDVWRVRIGRQAEDRR